MTARSRLQLLGNIQIIVVVVLVAAGGWFLHHVLGALFSAFIFLGTVFWASQYLFAMYDLDNRLDALGALLTFMLKINLPHIIIGEGHIEEHSNDAKAKTGGPGVLIVKNDSAAVTELGTRAKVRGPGIHVITEPFEAIKEIVDLRPQVRSDAVEAMTKDGVNIEVSFRVGFQIDSGGRHPDDSEPYPFSERGVLRAVYRSKQIATTGAKPWHERVPEVVFSNVREMIATHYLKDFFEPDQPGVNPRTELQDWLLDTSRSAALAIGVRITWVEFGTPRIPDEAIRKVFDNWRTKKWDAAVQFQDSRLTADRLQRLAHSLKDTGLSDETIRAILTQVFAPLPM